MTDPISPFLGTWSLDVEASDYEQSAPPRAGNCRIEAAGPSVTIHLQMIDAAGETVDASFTGVPDGRPQQLAESGLADALVLYLSQDGALVSEARRGEAVLMRAERRLSADGGLRVIQTVHLPDGTSAADTLVYRRAQ